MRVVVTVPEGPPPGKLCVAGAVHTAVYPPGGCNGESGAVEITHSERRTRGEALRDRRRTPGGRAHESCAGEGRDGGASPQDAAYAAAGEPSAQNGGESRTGRRRRGRCRGSCSRNAGAFPRETNARRRETPGGGLVQAALSVAPPGRPHGRETCQRPRLTARSANQLSTQTSCGAPVFPVRRGLMKRNARPSGVTS